MLAHRVSVRSELASRATTPSLRPSRLRCRPAVASAVRMADGDSRAALLWARRSAQIAVVQVGEGIRCCRVVLRNADRGMLVCRSLAQIRFACPRGQHLDRLGLIAVIGKPAASSVPHPQAPVGLDPDH